MPLPGNLTGVTLTGTYVTAVGTPCAGTVTFSLDYVIADATGSVILYPSATVATLDTNGHFSIELPATDDTHLYPEPFTYRVLEKLAGAQPRTYSISLPGSLAPTVDLSAITPTQPLTPVGVTISGTPTTGQVPTATGPNTADWQTPSGGGSGDLLAANNLSDIDSASAARTNLGLGSAATQASSAFDAAGTAATAQSNAEAYTTSEIAAEVSRANAAYPALANNLSDLPSESTARANLGLASGATAAAATTVVAESSYGQMSVVGTDLTYAREDHSHGTLSLAGSAPATTEGVGQAAALGSATLPARADHVHPLAAAGAPAASAVTSTQTTGVASTFAASDHVHAREGWGAPTAQTSFGASSATGSASTVPHSDHTHGTPTLPTASTSVAGVVQLDGTASDIQALGAQAAGSSGLAADAKHVHPTTGLVLGVTAADTSIVVGGTSGAPTVRTATLDVIATQHPAAAAWSNGGQKITGGANGVSGTDFALVQQLPAAATSGAEGTIQLAGDIGGTATSPTVVSTHLASALPVAQGGTGQASTSAAYNALAPTTTLGDIAYANGTGTNTRLPGSTSATKQYLQQTGNGSASAAPAWGTIAAGDLPAATTSAVGGMQFDGTATDINFLGVQAAGSTGKAADAGHVHPAYEWMPSDQGLIAWNYDPSSAGTTWVPTSTTNGYLFLTAMILRQSATLTNIVYGLSGAQTSGLTSGENLIGLYNSSGTLLTQTADQTTIWSTTADQKVNTVPWTTQQTNLAAGKYYVGFLYNGVMTGAALNFKASGAGTTANAGQTGANLRYGVITGTATSLPSSITLSSMATPSPFNSQWLGFS